LQLPAREHASQVIFFFQLECDRAPQLKASVGFLLHVSTIEMRTSRKTLLLLLISLVWCASFFGQTRKRANARRTVDPVPTVDFCDLTVHPERYSDKLVRVKASFVSWWESSYLYNVRCETAEKKIHDALDCSGDEDCEHLGKEVYGYINPRERADSHNYARRAYVIIIGRLIGPCETGFGHLNGFKFEFRIRKVEAASPMPRNIPYAK
jgi:hypothetical protein